MAAAGTTCIVREMDRVLSDLCAQGAKELRSGYEGSILLAGCTEPRDDLHIREEIGGSCIASVNQAINVLLSAGMSTPSLRRAAEAGLDIMNAAHMEFSGFSGMWAFGLVLSWSIVAEVPSLDFMGVALVFVAIVLIITYSVLLYTWPLDRTAFSLKVLNKIGCDWFVLCYLPAVLLYSTQQIKYSVFLYVSLATYSLVGCMNIGLSFLHVDGVMRQCGGKRLAQLLLAPRISLRCLFQQP
jgi:hypothetical protein